jgi:hypothetical protein
LRGGNQRRISGEGYGKWIAAAVSAAVTKHNTTICTVNIAIYGSGHLAAKGVDTLGLSERMWWRDDCRDIVCIFSPMQPAVHPEW